MPMTTVCRSGWLKWTTCSLRFTWSAFGWAVTKVFHFRVWYRDQLANYVREMLL